MICAPRGRIFINYLPVEANKTNWWWFMDRYDQSHSFQSTTIHGGWVVLVIWRSLPQCVNTLWSFRVILMHFWDSWNTSKDTMQDKRSPYTSPAGMRQIFPQIYRYDIPLGDLILVNIAGVSPWKIDRSFNLTLIRVPGDLKDCRPATNEPLGDVHWISTVY